MRQEGLVVVVVVHLTNQAFNVMQMTRCNSRNTCVCRANVVVDAVELDDISSARPMSNNPCDNTSKNLNRKHTANKISQQGGGGGGGELLKILLLIVAAVVVVIVVAVVAGNDF
jgi:hypothetical protein